MPPDSTIRAPGPPIVAEPDEIAAWREAGCPVSRNCALRC